jgi:hypothetical protein
MEVLPLARVLHHKTPESQAHNCQETTWPPALLPVNISARMQPTALVESVLKTPRLLQSLCPKVLLDAPLATRISTAAPADLIGDQPIRNFGAVALFRGGLLYALDSLEEAHSFFQNDASPLGSYWHGLMHRREGDFQNALYWFNRAGQIPVFAEMDRRVREAWRTDPTQNRWDPAAITKRFDRCLEGLSKDPPALLCALQRIECEVLLEVCWNRAVGNCTV